MVTFVSCDVQVFTRGRGWITKKKNSSTAALSLHRCALCIVSKAPFPREFSSRTCHHSTKRRGSFWWQLRGPWLLYIIPQGCSNICFTPVIVNTHHFNHLNTVGDAGMKAHLVQKWLTVSAFHWACVRSVRARLSCYRHVCLPSSCVTLSLQVIVALLGSVWFVLSKPVPYFCTWAIWWWWWW